MREMAKKMRKIAKWGRRLNEGEGSLKYTEEDEWKIRDMAKDGGDG